MTEQEIDSMPAGKEIERLITEKVMGWRLIPDEHQAWVRMAWAQLTGPHHDQIETAVVVPYADGTWRYEQPRWFSTDIHAIWPLVERMKPLRLWLIDLGDYWQAAFLEEHSASGVKANGDTPMLAICRAALKAKLMEAKENGQ
jgi:hypothetical protein